MDDGSGCRRTESCDTRGRVKVAVCMVVVVLPLSAKGAEMSMHDSCAPQSLAARWYPMVLALKPCWLLSVAVGSGSRCVVPTEDTNA